MRLQHKIATLMVGIAAASPVAPMAVTAAQAAPVTAQDDCTPWHPANDGEGMYVMDVNANLKVAFYASCGNVTYLHKGDVLYEQCWAYNARQNVWIYARVAGTSTYGWMYTGNASWVFHDENGDGVVSEKYC